MLHAPYVVDSLTALAMAAVALLLGRESAAQGWPELDARALPWIAWSQLPVALRGRAPLTVFAVVGAADAVYVGLGYWPVVCTFGPMLALYTVAALRPLRTALCCAAALTGLWIYAGLVTDGSSMPSVVGQGLLFSAVLVRFGALARRSAGLTRRLRAEQAERARREVAEERGRIARELHDVVAHHMSVISVQAGLARFVFDSDRTTSRTALDTIAGTSAEALDELRRMLQVLREEDLTGPGGGQGDAPAAPMPGLGRLEGPGAACARRWRPGRPPGRGRPAPPRARRGPVRVPGRAGGADQRSQTRPPRRRRRCRGPLPPAPRDGFRHRRRGGGDSGQSRRWRRTRLARHARAGQALRRDDQRRPAERGRVRRTADPADLGRGRSTGGRPDGMTGHGTTGREAARHGTTGYGTVGRRGGCGFPDRPGGRGA
ncbi:hypothetical protein QFZ63_003386 [Streptomyces sp. B3I7]|nr:hypothetical protein [Streptomyces sp. B3I7]